MEKRTEEMVEQERTSVIKMLEDLSKIEKKEGQEWHIVERMWFDSWAKYMKIDDTLIQSVIKNIANLILEDSSE